MAHYTSPRLGPPSGRTFAFGDTVTDANDVTWQCVNNYPPQWIAVYRESSGGTKTGATVTAAEGGDTIVRKTVLTLAATPVTITDALAYASQKIYTFPEGRILVFGALGSLQFAVTTPRVYDAGPPEVLVTIIPSATLSWAAGTSAASATSLASGMVDVLPSTNKVLSASGAALNTASTAQLGASAQFDGTGTAKDVYLNMAFGTGTDITTDGTVTATGTLTLIWAKLGDV